LVRGTRRGESERATRRGLFEITVSAATLDVTDPVFVGATALLRPLAPAVSRGE
jgi:hypothetical protein